MQIKNRLLTKAQLLRNAKSLRDDIEQYFRDGDSWNDNHPHDDRIDIDPGRVMQRTLESLHKQIAQMEAA